MIVLCAQVLLTPCGHCRPQVTASDLQHFLRTSQPLTSRSVEKRQTACENATQQFMQTFPQDCATQLGTLVFSDIPNQDGATLRTAFETICQPRCGNHFLPFFNQCGLSLQTEALIGLCAIKTDGSSCYQDFIQIISDLNAIRLNCASDLSTCAPSCHNALRASVRNGCCLNVLNSTVFSSSSLDIPSVYGYDRWSGCNVTTLGSCDISSLSSAEAPYFVKVLFALTIIVMAVHLF